MLQDTKNMNMITKKNWQTTNRLVSSPNSVSTDSALREQLHQEIENKSKSCNNPTYHCGIPRVDGFEYCIRHILRDPRGQYRQCTYVYGNGRKCLNAVLKHDNSKDQQSLTTFCFEHSRQAQLKKTRATVGKLRDIETNEILLHNLSHHIQLDEPSKEFTKSTNDELIDVVSPQVIQFSNYKNVNSMQNVLKAVRKKARILDFASDSSDEDVCAMKVTKLRKDFDDSDDESMGSDEDDTLRRASIYTIQESLKLSIEKLEKVRQLYDMQSQHLNYYLKERRRKYLIELRKEREMHCSIHDQAKNNAKERSIYSKLKLLSRYHRRHGHEAVLYRKYKEKRARSYDMQKTPSFPKCVFTEGGVKCADRTIPCSKFCRKHILEDKKQTLFRACHVEKSNVVCHEPTICIGEDSNCMLHLFIPPKQQYTQKKNDSETEDEDITLKQQQLVTSISTTTTTTTTDAATKILKQVNVLDTTKMNSIKSTANVEVIPIQTTTTTSISKQQQQQQAKLDIIKTKLEQQEETIKKVLQNSPKSISRRQQKRSNNRRKPWTNKPKKRLQQSSQLDEEDIEIEKDDNLITNKVEESSPTTTTVTTPVSTTILNSGENILKQQHLVVKKKSVELIKHHQSPALLQQQQQIEKQLQKQQVQQSPPQIFQIQNQQGILQQQQKLPIKPMTSVQQQQQQQQQPKTVTLATMKQMMNLQQLQKQQQQQQQQQILKLPTTTNVKQFVSLQPAQQQQQQNLPIFVRVPLTTTTMTTTTTSTSITIPQQQQQQQQRNLLQKQVIQLPVQRTTRFQFQQTSGVTSGSNITYHTIPGLPKSTSVIINKQFVPKSMVGQQQPQQSSQQQKIQANSQQQQQQQQQEQQIQEDTITQETLQ